jgi:hypothetical protein
MAHDASFLKRLHPVPGHLLRVVHRKSYTALIFFFNPPWLLTSYMLLPQYRWHGSLNVFKDVQLASRA